MKDKEKRTPGKYKEEYSKIIQGKKVHITEETVVGRDFEILSFSREYDPPLPYEVARVTQSVEVSDSKSES